MRGTDITAKLAVPADHQRGNMELATPKRRRWLLAVDPIFEGGRQGARARRSDVEDELVAIALLGDVTIDLSDTRSAPAEITVEAYAIGRDVDVLVAAGVHVELSGRGLRGHLCDDVPAAPAGRHDLVVRIHGHTLLGDVTARIAPGSRSSERPGALDRLMRRRRAAAPAN
jgi:hypothetical protein